MLRDYMYSFIQEILDQSPKIANHDYNGYTYGEWFQFKDKWDDKELLEYYNALLRRFYNTH